MNQSRRELIALMRRMGEKVNEVYFSKETIRFTRSQRLTLEWIRGRALFREIVYFSEILLR